MSIRESVASAAMVIVIACCAYGTNDSAQVERVAAASSYNDDDSSNELNQSEANSQDSEMLDLISEARHDAKVLNAYLQDARELKLSNKDPLPIDFYDKMAEPQSAIKKMEQEDAEPR